MRRYYYTATFDYSCSCSTNVAVVVGIDEKLYESIRASSILHCTALHC
jgi:hypothetical protein